MLAQTVTSSLASLSKQLLEASRRGNDDAVRTLLAQGASFTSDWLGTSALHLACMNGHISTVQILTRAGTSWDGRTKADKTPMHFAAQYGHRDVVAMLLKLGADVNATDMLQMTPLHWAVIEDHFLVVKLLIENNADLSIQNKFDKTPIQSAQDACNYHLVEYIKTSMNHLNYDEEDDEPPIDTPPAAESTNEVLASLAALSGSSATSESFPWLPQDSVASGAQVLLDGVNMVTLTEAGKLALQACCNLYDDEPTKENALADSPAAASSSDNGQKVLSFTLANQMIASAQSNQPLTLVVSPQKSKSKLDNKFIVSKRKRKHSGSREEKPLDDDHSYFGTQQKEDLERQLAAARSEMAIYREKLQLKEQEVNICRKKLEDFQQSRT